MRKKRIKPNAVTVLLMAAHVLIMFGIAVWMSSQNFKVGVAFGAYMAIMYAAVIEVNWGTVLRREK